MDWRLVEITAPDAATLAKIGALRLRAWATVVPQAAELPTWLDRFEAQGRHWLAYRGDELIAAARLSVHQRVEDAPDPECFAGLFPQPLPTPIASFNRLVVDPSARKLGISRQLDAVRLDRAEALGCACAVGTTAAGPHRVRQMTEMGFRVVGVGKPFLDPPLSYLPAPVVLVCRLPRPKP